MTENSRFSFEQMLTTFSYHHTSLAAADDVPAEGSQTKHDDIKGNPTPKRRKATPAAPRTPPRPSRRRTGHSSFPQPDASATGDRTAPAASATTTPTEAMAADSVLTSTSEAAEHAWSREQRRDLAVTVAVPGTPLVLPPGKVSRFSLRQGNAGETREEDERVKPAEAGEEGEGDASPDGVNERNRMDAANKRKKRRKRSCGGLTLEDMERKPEKKKKKKVVMVSPYFTSASSDPPALEGRAGIEGKVEMVVQRKRKKKRTGEAVESSAEPETSSATPSREAMAGDEGDGDPSPDGGNGRDRMDAATKRKKRRKRSFGGSMQEEMKRMSEKKKKKKVVVVSPYFTSTSSDRPALEGGAGVEGEVEVVVQSKRKKKRTSEAVESSDEPGTSSGRRQGPSKGVDGNKNRKKELQSIQLSTAERMADAYKRVPDDNPWVPPFSEHELLQEFHFFDHWRVLVICMLLNRTTGREVQKVLPRLFLLCPDAQTTTRVPKEEIEDIIRHLGLQKKRSKMIKRMSEEYLRPEWTHVTQLLGIGKYAADAYAIFCSGMWKEVKPIDHKLVDYWRFLLNDKDARESIVVQKST